jgi:hypothetical protein
MPTPTIADRVTRIDTIADLYGSASGSHRLDIVADLMADSAHWCAAHSIDFDQAVRTAHLHAAAERAETGLGRCAQAGRS